MALTAALLHLAFCLLLEVEDYAVDLHRATDGFGAITSFVGKLALLQAEPVLVAAAVGVLAGLSSRSRRTWMVFILMFTVLNVYLVIDQIAYGIFLDHLQLSLSEGRVTSINAILSSGIAEFGALAPANMLLAIALSAALVFLPLHRARALQAGLLSNPVRIIVMVVIMSTYVAVAASAASLWPNHNLEHHPLLALLFSAATPSSPSPPQVQEPVKFDAPTYGAYEESPSDTAALLKAQEEIRAVTNHANLILVVLESVGSKQLLTNGVLDAANAPTLARLARSSVIFDSIYTTFPGTMRAHLPMVTGGRTLTWGSVFREATYPFTAPTLPREFKRAGYGTAFMTSGDLDFEKMDVFVGQAGYDMVFHAGLLSDERRQREGLNSWGVNEDVLRGEALRWIDSQHTDGNPFFLQLLTLATHHPYSVPEGFREAANPSDALSRYRAALRYTDGILGMLVDDLKARGLLEHTLIAITGDHGEAFGDLHFGNYTHMNAIYDENIRSFLMIVAPDAIRTTLVSRRVGTFGDIMPTLLALFGLPAAAVPGQDLFADKYVSRPVYFHKNTHPELWGLRDRQWKFIGGRGPNPVAELYDLGRDPDEQHNLAPHHPAMIERYARQCSEWFIASNEEFVRNLSGFQYEGGRGLAGAELQSYGPKVLAFGIKAPSGEFITPQSIDSYAHVVAYTKWVSYPADKIIRYEWQSPSGATISFPFTVKSEWSSTWVNLGAPVPIEQGRWQLTLWDGGTKLLTGSFAVTR